MNLSCFAKRKRICSFRGDIFRAMVQRWRHAHLIAGLGKAEVMRVMKCLGLRRFVFLAVVLIAGGERKKLKKEKEEAGFEH